MALTLAYEVDSKDVKVFEELALAEARKSFFAFRRFMRPGIKVGWWLWEVAREFERFRDDFKAGLRPKLIFEAPPQHGKTTLVEDMVAWLTGDNPLLRTMFTSYSDNLGIRVNTTLQRMMDSPKYHALFKIGIPPHGQAWASRNSEYLEFVRDRTPTGGNFRNTTVKGQVTGQALDLGIVDDPLKGRNEANSPTVRNSTWSWLTDDFFTRFSNDAAMLMTLTRWHVDDPAARFIEKFPETRVLRYPAIAEENEKYRRKGEPLFPELKSLAFLKERQAIQTRSSFLAMYQQSPTIIGGGMFPIEQFKVVQALPAGEQVKRAVRYWDKAGTDGGGAETAGVLLLTLRDGTFVVADVQHGHLSAQRREKLILQTALLDSEQFNDDVEIYVEQEPGSGGKESAENSIRMLAGHRAFADKVTGSKEVRAEPYAAQVQAGNVFVLYGPWTKAFLDQHEAFPNDPLKDIVDAAAGAFNKSTLTGYLYDASQDWVGSPWNQNSHAQVMV